MLIRFTLKNYSSFCNDTELSLIPGRGTRLANHKTSPVRGVSVLKTAVVYGANASGKSSLVKAMAFGKELVMREKKNVTLDFQPFLLDGTHSTMDSEMEYEIQTNGKNYCYGFVFNKKMIVEEWFVEKSKRGKDIPYYSLSRNKNTGDIEFNFEGLKKRNKKEESQQFIQFIAKATPINQLFLHEVFTRNMSQNVEDISDLQAVIKWFANTLKIIRPDETYKMGFTLQAAGSENLRKTYSMLLKYFDTGIETINLVEVDFDKLPIPGDLASKIKNDILQNGNDRALGTLVMGGNMFLISNDNGKIQVQKLMTVHKSEMGDDVPFELQYESDGTLRLLDYIPLLIDLLQGDKVFVVDEMERSLHPNLIHALIELFLTISEGINSQLILTTHESTLLNQDLLRKDEIWFVVRDKMKSSLVALEEYSVRFDKDIRSEYLRGTYKGVPIIGDISLIKDSLS